MHRLDILRLIWGLGFILYLSLTLNVALLCRFVWTKQTVARRKILNICLPLFALLAMLFILESLFAFLVVQSDGKAITLGARLWLHRYWNPINSHGYRDYDTKHFDGRSVVFIVGDSFVAGYGIKRIEDRFANRLAHMLGDGWEHVVIAKNGWQTGTQLKAIGDYPIDPDVIILSHYINDIEGAAKKNGFSPHRYVQGPGKLTAKFVNKSFFLNWLYWRVYRGFIGNYWKYLQNSYSNPKIWNTHRLELQAFVDYAESINAHLYAVIWPCLQPVSASREFTSKVVGFLRSQGVSVVDLAEVFEDRPGSELVVNKLDGHPNPETHHEVAALIYKELSKIRGLEKR